KGGADLADTDIRVLGAGHHVDAVAHAPKGKGDPDVLHVHELVDQQGEVEHKAVRGQPGDDHVHAVDVVGGRVLEQLAQVGDLLGGQLLGEVVRDDLDVHALALEPACGLEIVRGGGVEAEGAGVLVDAEPEQGGFLCVQGHAAFSHLVH